MDREERQNRLFEFIEDAYSIKQGGAREFYKDLSEALYTCNESGVFGDINIDSHDAFIIYALVQTIKEKRFPKELLM